VQDDRFLNIDGETVYPCDGSIKDLGKNRVGFAKLEQSSLKINERVEAGRKFCLQ